MSTCRGSTQSGVISLDETTNDLEEEEEEGLYKLPSAVYHDNAIAVSRRKREEGI